MVATPKTTAANNPQQLSVGQVIVSIAKSLGVDPNLALAQAWTESGLNPKEPGDYGYIDSYGHFHPLQPGTAGGQYTSFGLYQLHMGGELGNLDPTQAYDPQTNAQVALSHVAAVAKQNPTLTPGQIAAVAGGPADPQGYANTVNTYYQDLASGNYPAGFEQAFNAPSNVSTQQLPADAQVAGFLGLGSQIPFTGPKGVPNNLAGTSSAGSSSDSSQQETAGFLHTMNNLMNPDSSLNPVADIKNVAIVIMVRGLTTLFGVGVMLGGLAILFVDVSKEVASTTNPILNIAERSQRIVQRPEQLRQSRERIDLQRQAEQRRASEVPA